MTIVISLLFEKQVNKESKRSRTESMPYYTIDVEWYVSDHAVRRTKRKENIEEMTMEEIEDMCEKATDELIRLFTDKTIRINPHTGFHFQIRNIENYYATLGCMIVSYVPMEQIEIVVKTTTKS